MQYNHYVICILSWDITEKIYLIKICIYHQLFHCRCLTKADVHKAVFNIASFMLSLIIFTFEQQYFLYFISPHLITCNFKSYFELGISVDMCIFFLQMAWISCWTDTKWQGKSLAWSTSLYKYNVKMKLLVYTILSDTLRWGREPRC